MKTIRIKGTLHAILKTKDDKEVTTSHFTGCVLRDLTRKGQFVI